MVGGDPKTIIHDTIPHLTDEQIDRATRMVKRRSPELIPMLGLDGQPVLVQRRGR